MVRGASKQKIQTESLAVGGQAVMEGVMMRNKDVIATAVRLPKGTIVVKKDTFTSLSKKFPPLGWPFIRGITNLIEILLYGMKMMIWSSNQSLGEEEEFSKWELFWTILFSVLLSIGIFKLIPLFMATVIQAQTGGNNLFFNLIDASFKIGMLVVYIWGISKLQDVHRLFQYHGAEHKTINCYEHNMPLTPKNVLAQSRLHPRCGTTFILFIFFIGILVYLIIPMETSFWQKLLLRLAYFPIITSVSYELIKLAGKYYNNPIMKIIIAPGLLLQRLTTKEPDKQQVEVAIRSLKEVI